MRARSWLALGILLGGVLPAAGLALFVRQASLARPRPVPSDAIVVLTGGALRVETGIVLLEAHAADRILISGVGDRVTLASLLATVPPRMRAEPGDRGEGDDTDDGAAPSLRDRITLGHDAQTTFGNAAEVAAWTRARGLHSLIVVTAGYHMPRAMAELRAALPGVTLRPYPVHPEADLRVMAVEYVKFLAVELSLALAPPPSRLTG